MQFQSTPPSRVATEGSIERASDDEFQSTPPSRVATRARESYVVRKKISIHTTLAGGDISWITTARRLVLFQSTPPSRVATTERGYCSLDDKFQSTPPSRVATCHILFNIRHELYFNPHHPRGWRPFCLGKSFPVSDFNPHHPRGWRLSWCAPTE